MSVIHGDIHTSDGLTKSLSSLNLRNILAIDVFRIVTGVGGNYEKELRIQTLIVYPGSIQGGRDMDIDMRRKTRAGGSSN